MKNFEQIQNGRLLPATIALLAAALFGLNAPISKLLLSDITPILMVALLYLGAGSGMLILRCIFPDQRQEAPLSKREMPWTIAMILLDVGHLFC